MATRMKPIGWPERDRNSQLANALYPHLSDDTTKRQMLNRAAEDGGQGRAGLEKRIAEGLRSYNKAKPASEPGPYDRVPGLVKQPEASAKKSWWEK